MNICIQCGKEIPFKPRHAYKTPKRCPDCRGVKNTEPRKYSYVRKPKSEKPRKKWQRKGYQFTEEEKRRLDAFFKNTNDLL